MNSIRNSLRAQSFVSIGVVGVFFALVIGLAVYWFTTALIQSHFEEQVSLSAESLERAILLHVGGQRRSVVRLALDDDFARALGEGGDSAELDELLSTIKGDGEEFADLEVVAADGRVIASTHAADIGTDVSGAAWWTDGKADSDVGLIQESPAGELAYPITVPVRDESDARVGRIVVWCDADPLYELLIASRSESTTRESYLIDDDGVLRSPSRFESDAELEQTASGGPLAALRSGREALGEWENYRADPVLGTVNFDDLHEEDIRWAVVTEVATADLDAIIAGPRNYLAALLALSVLLAAAGSYVSATALTSPITDLAGAARQLGAGDLRTDVARSSRTDELGTLVNAFADAVATVRGLVTHLRGGVRQLSSSSAEIGATATQYAATAAEQASSVAEISATVEEIKQTSQAAAATARDVAQSGDEAARQGRDGRDRLDRSVDAMRAINDRVGAIAIQILRLSEQTAQIGAIVESVNDLAEQSNLLAVNASIEAAKAGEHGRGFAVVATEVRSLSEQSKRATQQIRTILGEIQRATQSAVMATEEGTKRADDGQRALEALRDVIEALAGTLEDTSGKGRQIAGAATQQASGIAQIAAALDAVSKAGKDNAKGVKQLEQAVRDLVGIANELGQTADKFRV